MTAVNSAELYEEMAVLATDLSSSGEAKSGFLGVIAHELRTPLSVIAGYAEMLRDKGLGKINYEQQKALDKVIGQSKNLLAIINAILQMARIEAEEARVKEAEVDLVSLLDELKLTYGAPLNKELELVWDYPRNLPAIKTDSEKLKWILLSLIGNAVKFTEKGLVAVSVRCLNGAGADESRPIEFEVTDTGIGIGKQFLPFIFEKFRQADSSNARHYGGMGIGLYVAKRFTDILGGVIEARSELGKGSIFRVVLPDAAAEWPRL